jgi:uncharacterized membrane protein YfcA
MCVGSARDDIIFPLFRILRNNRPNSAQNQPVYLALMGVLILAHALRAFPVMEPTKRGMPAVGFFGGILDAIGGGGWGPVVTSTLIGGGHVPRKVIGSVNLTEFFVTVVTSATLIVTLGVADLSPVIPLILGGLVVAPFADIS